jgi:uncharacterized membrane protein YqiK
MEVVMLDGARMEQVAKAVEASRKFSKFDEDMLQRLQQVAYETIKPIDYEDGSNIQVMPDADTSRAINQHKVAK